jgi:hypothetical protein
MQQWFYGRKKNTTPISTSTKPRMFMKLEFTMDDDTKSTCTLALKRFTHGTSEYITTDSKQSKTIRIAPTRLDTLKEKNTIPVVVRNSVHTIANFAFVDTLSKNEQCKLEHVKQIEKDIKKNLEYELFLARSARAPSKKRTELDALDMLETIPYKNRPGFQFLVSHLAYDPVTDVYIAVYEYQSDYDIVYYQYGTKNVLQYNAIAPSDVVEHMKERTSRYVVEFL